MLPDRIEFGHDLLLITEDAWGQLAVEMVPQRVRVRGQTIQMDERVEHKQVGDWQYVPGVGQPQEYQALLECRFFATLDGGRVATFEANGPAFSHISAESKDWPRQKETVYRCASAGVFSALTDALAYIPPKDSDAGTVWRVHRDRVWPYQPYGFYMITSGAGWASEDSTCVVEAVRNTKAGHVATVRIDGRRVPGPPEPSEAVRVSHLSLKGRLEVNLDTGEVTELCIETKPSFVNSEDASMNITFKDTIRLAPK
jgi:hypothetical protein